MKLSLEDIESIIDAFEDAYEQHGEKAFYDFECYCGFTPHESRSTSLKSSIIYNHIRGEIAGAIAAAIEKVNH